MFRSTPFALLWLAAGAACGVGRDAPQKMAQALQSNAAAPDEVPRMLNTERPFRYPAALYARRVQGNVVLRLHIDRDGRVVPDSTRVDEHSAHAALDSAALRGASELRFVPARLNGEPMGVSVLFPVYFRHPEAPALPGDTILHRAAEPAATTRTP